MLFGEEGSDQIFQCWTNVMIIVFQGGDVESTFMFGQENRFIMICDIRSSLNFSLVYMRNGKKLSSSKKNLMFLYLDGSLYKLLLQITLCSDNQHVSFSNC